MLEILLFLIYVCNTNANNFTCTPGLTTCIPLSECDEIQTIIQTDLTADVKQYLCGYFHEPFVCCDRNCVTPNGNYGRELPLNDCPHLKINGKSTERKRRFLSESFINRTHVCCKEGEDNYISVPAIPIPETLTSSCTTPNGEKASCTHLNSCPAYKEAELEIDGNFQFINDSFCGIWKEPMICCGDVSYYKEAFAQNLPGIDSCGDWEPRDDSSLPPWLAIIEMKDPARECVGALINDEYVLATTKCTGKKNISILNIKLGACIYNKSRKECDFGHKEINFFPLQAFIPSEDLGMVLIKLNGKISVGPDLMPVCLPTTELPIFQEIEVVGAEKTSHWTLTRILSTTISNDDCHKAKKSYFERIVCLRNKNLCSSNTQMGLARKMVLQKKNGRWYLEGLFNTDDCYGVNGDYLNAIYVYKYLSWIKSNIK